MGVLLSKIRHNLSSKEQLERITKDLDDIHDRRIHTQLQQKRVIGILIVISVFIYIIAALVFFIWYFPPELIWKIVYSIPLFVFPFLIWGIKHALQWYFRYSLSQNEVRVSMLLRERKKLLDDVKEKETYKVAKELLEKYDPDQLATKPSGSMLLSPSISLGNLTQLPDTELRRRASFGNKRTPSQPSRALNVPATTQVVRPSAVVKPGYNAPPGVKVAQPQVLSRPGGIPLPCPILPRQRGGFDRLVEYMLGDGPGNRYALICRQCHSHNGMALQEEFEYISYRCCYCYYFNAARKQKPLAPKLSLPDGKQSPSIVSSSPLKQPDLTIEDSQIEDLKSSEISDNEESKDTILYEPNADTVQDSSATSCEELSLETKSVEDNKSVEDETQNLKNENTSLVSDASLTDNTILNESDNDLIESSALPNLNQLESLKESPEDSSK